jgi:ornithine cyclodeaminase/alanine dehydrogenase-like protein (mu-crystallin family)
MPTEALPFISGDALRRAVPIGDVIDAVDRAYRDVVAGRDRSPIRAHVPIPLGDLLLMPGTVTGAAGFTVKLVTVVEANAARALPTVQAVVVWFSAATGAPLAMIDGPTLTAMRTGAASGVATRLLARRDARTLALLGVGAQAEWQLRAVLAVRAIERVAVFARTAERRMEFARRFAEETGVDVRAASSADEAVRDADVVCCATTSATPVFDAASLRDGAHVNGVGAFRLDMVELPPELFTRADVVAVDSRAAALAEAGDVVSALRANRKRKGDLVEIGSVAAEWADARDPRAVTVFKSVGLAAQDVATAELAVRRVLPALEGA